MLGEFDEEHWAFQGSSGSINKALVVTGGMNLYSCPIPIITSRLKVNAPNDDFKKQIVVDYATQITWKVGDTLAIASTTMRTMDTEKCVIESINGATI